MIIYEPKGKALEYSPLAANLYRGCSHACTYCYAPAATYRQRENFNKPETRKEVLEYLEKDARRLAGDTRTVLLCFTCDPYQHIDIKEAVTREAIRILNKHGLGVSILTKGGSRAIRDFDLLKKYPTNSFGTTLTHDDYAMSFAWEPGAEKPSDRIYTIKQAHQSGIKTWVSFEPVIDPEAVYRLLERTHLFVDLYKVGKLNYNVKAKETDWPAFRERITSRLKALGKEYIIKKDLLAEAIK